jgi:hypothetical protein
MPQRLSENYECFAISRRLFVDESKPKPKPYKRRNKLGWLKRIVAELNLRQNPASSFVYMGQGIFG